MSTLKGIFEPFKDYVIDQLQLRKKILKNKNVGFDSLPQEFFAFSGKQCTIRMASGVNIKGDSGNVSPLFNMGNKWENDLHGSRLARNWVLEGGILDSDKKSWVKTDEATLNARNKAEDKGSKEYSYNGVVFATSTTSLFDPVNNDVYPNGMDLYKKALKGDIEYKTDVIISNVNVGETAVYTKSLRGGIGKSGTYGDPKLRANYDDGFGIVPMPGIVDAEIRTKSNDGSLREAQVNFVCHNRKQLEILETLYMRPGYPILLEWGWNPYISNNKTIEDQYSVLDAFFKENNDLTALNHEINNRKSNSGGNYDGFVGFIKNFSFKATESGGYECSTEIIAQGEILESLKSAKVVIPNMNISGSLIDEDPEAEVIDKFLFFLRSIKKTLEQAGDDKYIISKNTDLEDGSNWQKFKKYFGFKNTAEENKAENIVMDKINPRYLGGYTLILDLIKNILKVTDKVLKTESQVNSRSLEYGYDSFLFGTFIQEIAQVKKEGEKGSGKDKSVYIRWDMLCQIINHLCTPTYKSHGEPVVELTYLNNNQRVYNLETDPEFGQIPKSGDPFTALNGKHYLDYSLPAENKLHPAVNDEDLKRILGQSFDYGVCIMPHQFEDSLIVQKYDDSYVTPSPPEIPPIDEEETKKVIINQNSGGIMAGGSATLETDQMYDMRTMSMEDFGATYKYDSNGTRIPPEGQFEDNLAAETTNTDQDAQNEAENYQPLTSYTEVKFTNKSIGLVYFNLDHLLSTYEGMRLVTKTIDEKKVIRLKEKFSFLDFINQIWEDVNESCANYYDFNLQTEHERPHVARIIDKTPSGKAPAPGLIFEFDPQGLNSQVRDFNFSSKISSDIASTISIAAQSPNDAKSLEALSFKSFHKNIRNRFTSDEIDPKQELENQKAAKVELEEDLTEYKNKFILLKKYQDRSNNQYRVRGGDQVDQFGRPLKNIDSTRAIQLAKEIEELCIKINTKFPLLNTDGEDHPQAGLINENSTQDRNAIIPLEFSLLLDGISGISPLNLFKINKKKLPYGYQRDDIAFIVKGESQKITAGQDWTVSLEGQLTLLNTDDTDYGKNVVPPKPPEPVDPLNDIDDDEALLNPTEDQNYPITLNSSFPFRNNGVDLHLGLDIGLPSGVPLVAVQDGTVLKKLQGGDGKGGYGQYIILTLDKADKTTGVQKILYAHLSEVLKEGKVKKGDVIAKSGGAKGDYGAGSSGSDRSPHFGAHLHYETGTNQAFTGAYFGKTRKNRLDTGLILNPLDTINYNNSIGNRINMTPKDFKGKL